MRNYFVRILFIFIGHFLQLVLEACFYFIKPPWPSQGNNTAPVWAPVFSNGVCRVSGNYASDYDSFLPNFSFMFIYKTFCTQNTSIWGLSKLAHKAEKLNHVFIYLFFYYFFFKGGVRVFHAYQNPWGAQLLGSQTRGADGALSAIRSKTSRRWCVQGKSRKQWEKKSNNSKDRTWLQERSRSEQRLSIKLSAHWQARFTESSHESKPEWLRSNTADLFFLLLHNA